MTEKTAKSAITFNISLIILSLFSLYFTVARSIPSFNSVNSSLMASEYLILLKIIVGRKLKDMCDGL